MRGPASVAHLAGRFFGSIRPGPPTADDEAWAASHLGPGELALWQQMSNPDRRHAVQVARDVVGALSDGATDAVIAAALLHDSGKVVSNYRTPMRVVATLVWSLVDPARAHAWLDAGPPRRRLAEYRLHPELGADLLAAADADDLVVRWAREHHRPEDRWTIDPRIGSVLKHCDGD
ncbi:MAG: HD domain-containing protein [Acidimicrobiales bacterium]